MSPPSTARGLEANFQWFHLQFNFAIHSGIFRRETLPFLKHRFSELSSLAVEPFCPCFSSAGASASSAAHGKGPSQISQVTQQTDF